MEALYNPFKRLRGAAALGVGVAVIAVLGVVNWAGGVHLDGALDLHYVPGKLPSPEIAALENLVAWLSLAVCFALAGVVMGGRVGSVLDYLGMTAVARWPYIPMALVGSKWGLGRYVEQLTQVLPGNKMQIDLQPLMDPAFMVPFLLLSGLVLVFVVWSVTLLVFAFKEAAGTTGWRTAVGVVGGLIAAEIISKVALWGYVKAGFGL